MSCPICQADTVADYRPFCSKRCADIDLARWFNGTYTMPIEDEDAERPDSAEDPDGAAR
ncbi:MAG: DNA gyrase inhibitor YacG [Pseudomonadota bacterium]